MDQQNKNRNITCSIVIPVYKSSKSLIEITHQINELIKKQNQSLELIFVNDSPLHSATRNTLEKLSTEYPFVKKITLRKNQGQHLAIIVGMSYTIGKYVITMDDDLQHPISEIPRLINAMQADDEVDAMFAISEFQTRNHKFHRKFGSYMLSKIDSLFLDKPKGIVKSSFRIMKQDLSKAIVRNFNAMPSISSLIIKHTHNIKNLNVEHHKRKYGKSTYNLKKLISLTLNNLINFSSLPLKIVGVIGLFSFLFALAFVSITIIRHLFFGIAYPGYTSIVALTGILGGLNLLSVGIIGEYLIRILRDLQKPILDNLVRDIKQGE